MKDKNCLQFSSHLLTYLHSFITFAYISYDHASKVKLEHNLSFEANTSMQLVFFNLKVTNFCRKYASLAKAVNLV